jgi:hypothetical protein
LSEKAHREEARQVDFKEEQSMTRIRHRPRITSTFVCLFVLLGSSVADAASSDPNQVLAQSRAAYAALHSYADSGVLTTTYRSPGAPAIIEHFTFATAYDPPRQFLFDFRRDPKLGVMRFVIWANGAEFNTWWSDTKVHDSYPQGQGATAFAMGSEPTKTSALAIAPLLFAKAGLHGVLTDLADLKNVGIEQVDHRPCYKLVGKFGLAYGSGNVRGARTTTIWVDTQSSLVRKISEDTPDGTGGGFANQIEITIEPTANRAINPKVFAVSVPQN